MRRGIGAVYGWQKLRLLGDVGGNAADSSPWLVAAGTLFRGALSQIGGYMILRRFFVTLIDNRRPMRRFFTLYGARRWCAKIGVNAHLYEWTGSQWLERI